MNNYNLSFAFIVESHKGISKNPVFRTIQQRMISVLMFC
jgi:hypothetical protein